MIFKERRLRHDVDDAAGIAAPEQGAGRPLQNLHFFIVEAVAGIDAEVTQAVHIDVILGIEAADLELIARQCAAFTDRDGDAGHVAKALLQRADCLLLQLFLRNDLNGLRRILYRGGQHRETGVVVLRIGHCAIGHLHRTEHNRLIVSRVGRQRGNARTSHQKRGKQAARNRVGSHGGRIRNHETSPWNVSMVVGHSGWLPWGRTATAWLAVSGCIIWSGSACRYW